LASPPSFPTDSPELSHISEDDLEAFAMGKPLQDRGAHVHAHLLACDACCLRLVREAEFIEALRIALREFKE